MEQLELILDEAHLDDAARKLLEFASTHRVFLFDAEMGAGKTTFIKAICRVLGVKDNTSSPTYSIVNEYHNAAGEKIYHFDLYRLNNMEECLDIGFEEYIHSGAYCFIEWPEIAKALIVTKVINISISMRENLHYLCASKS